MPRTLKSKSTAHAHCGTGGKGIEQYVCTYATHHTNINHIMHHCGWQFRFAKIILKLTVAEEATSSTSFDQSTNTKEAKAQIRRAMWHARLLRWEVSKMRGVSKRQRMPRVLHSHHPLVGVNPW